MQIKVKDIPGDGLELQERVLPSEIGLENDEKLYRCISPLTITAHAERADDVIIVQARVEGICEYNCARCFEKTSQDRVDHFELYIDYDPTVEFIDLGEEIRQEMVIALNGIMVCREDCKGICATCGANLNKEKCSCKSMTGHKDTMTQ